MRQRPRPAGGSNAPMDFLTQCSDTRAPDSPHFRLLSSAFVEAVPSSRKLFVASLSISYLIYKAQGLGEILSDLLA